MKFKLIATTLLLVVLGAMYVVFSENNSDSNPASVQDSNTQGLTIQ